MEPLAQLQAKHRKEQRELQSRITQMKKGATKKTRKGVNTECDELGQSLKDRQKKERGACSGDHALNVDDLPVFNRESADEDRSPKPSKSLTSEPLNGLAEAAQNSNISDPTNPEDSEPRKRNRQKERLARRAAEQEASALQAEAEADKLPNWKRQERTSMLKAFNEHGLVEKEIAPDGHCMFSAVADQLREAGIPLNETSEKIDEREGRHRMVRKTAAHYIEGHPDEFAGFLDEPLGTYVNKIRDTAEWGGHIELIALAKSYNVEIRVLQDGRMDRFDPNMDSSQEPEKIWLAYYRHGYGLGEHYNSLRKAP